MVLTARVDFTKYYVLTLCGLALRSTRMTRPIIIIIIYLMIIVYYLFIIYLLFI